MVDVIKRHFISFVELDNIPSKRSKNNTIDFGRNDKMESFPAFQDAHTRNVLKKTS